MFDKKQYWDRRKHGLRGQGDFRHTMRGHLTRNEKGFLIEATVGNKPVSKKAFLKNTKRARKAAMHV